MILTAYFRGPKPPSMQIVPASRWRPWMNETIARNANRCLPLLVANESGWLLLNERPFRAEWNGGDSIHDLVVTYERGIPASPAVSNFGHGILTFTIPYLFRTPEGWDMLVRGPTNSPRDGIAPLDGIVETDWALATFTMNWKFTRPGAAEFAEAEPFCMVVPQVRHGIEAMEPVIRSASAGDGAIGRGWEAGVATRKELHVKKFLTEFTGAHPEAADAWESDYFRGRTAEGQPASDHVTRRRLSPFVSAEADAGTDDA